MINPLIADRVQETTSTTGTGTISLAGAVSGFRTFSLAFATGSSIYYCMQQGTNWEVGIGTLTIGTPSTLARTTVLTSSNTNALVSFPGPSTNVFNTAPASLLQRDGNKTLTASYNMSVYDSGLFLDIWNIAVSAVLGTPTTFPAGFNVEFTGVGAGSTGVTLYNNTAGLIYLPDGVTTIASLASFAIPPGITGSSFELREFGGVAYLHTVGRTIVTNAVNTNEAVALGQGDGRYAALAGLSTLLFNVAAGSATANAIPLGQGDGRYAAYSLNSTKVNTDVQGGNIGVILLCHLGGTVAVGVNGTIGGASLSIMTSTTTAMSTGGGVPGGTWRNVSVATIGTGSYGTFQRIS